MQVISSRQSIIRPGERHEAGRVGLVGAEARAPIELFIFLATLMNFGLAIVNAHFFGLSQNGVVATQLVLVIAAAVYALINYGAAAPQFYGLVVVVVACAVSCGIANARFDPRFLHDVLLIPMFTVIGASCGRLRARPMLVLLGLVAAIAAFELALPTAYAWLANPLRYYAETRTWALQTAIQQHSSLSNLQGFYVGAQRFQGNGLTSLGTHRASSVFLEPLSLAYFAVVFWIYAAQEEAYRRHTKWLIYATCLVLCLISDTRTAFLTLLLLKIFEVPLKRLPVQWAIIWPVGGAIGVVALSSVFAGHASDLIYRLSLTTEPLKYGGARAIFFGGFTRAIFGDSGVIYLLNGTGLIGAFAFYMLLVGGSFRVKNPGTSHSVGIFIVIVAIFGGAFLSIKTAALTGALLGSATSLPRFQKQVKA
jgi:hypothetical protein